MIRTLLCFPARALRSLLRAVLLAAVVACAAVVFGCVALSDWVGVARDG